MQKDLFIHRRRIIEAAIILSCCVIIFRTLQIQVIGSKYRHGFQKPTTVYPSRGGIYDRKGKQLVNNEPTFDLQVTYRQVNAKDIDTNKFCDLLQINKDYYISSLNKVHEKKNGISQYHPATPFDFYKNVPAPIYSKFIEYLHEFQGFEFVTRSVRGYNEKIGAHVLGYISEVTPEQIKKDSVSYSRGDYIGSNGLELSYEEVLRGKKGIKNLLKDNLGRIKGSYRSGHDDVPAESGLSIISTIDAELQGYGEELMKNKKGAIVAIEPSTGEVLALISSPTYDPGLLTINRDRGVAFAALNRNDTLKPLLNRAVQSKYPPGSTFKPVMALIGLHTGKLWAERAIGCHGGWNYNRLHVACHGHPYAGNLATALAHSCNAYFCQTFREVVEKYGFKEAPRGLDELVDMLHKFGLGVKLGIDIPSESGGNIPNSKYYDRVYKKGGWWAPTIISMGIGQGEVETTPLQMANVTAIIANRGYFYTPHLAKELVAYDDVKDKSYVKKINDKFLGKFHVKHETGVSVENFEIVIRGMEDAVDAGTAYASKIPGVEMCGKTGTVENSHGKNHSTFIAFAPKENPKIAICVFVENSGFGATYAAPIASLMIEKYVNGIISDHRKAIEERMKNANLLGKP